MLAGSAAWLLLGIGGCGSANPDLFGSGPAAQTGGSSITGVAGSASSSAGMEASTSGSEGVAGNPGNNAGSGGSGGSGAGCAFSCGDAGRGASGNVSGSGSAGAAGDGGAQAGSGSEPNECSAFAADAIFLPATQHCYVVDSEPRNFAAAQDHCTDLKAHLITLSDKAENDFAWSLLGDEHWIGAKDGKLPRQPGVGTYTWVTGEPFDYTNWSLDQPNASKTECMEASGGGACYEHCAFQWKGGEHEGEWNDRYCTHTIASICEWDSTP